MIRNEIDIIELFVNHLVREVDEIHIVDHLSDDGTYETLRQYHNSGLIRLYRYEAPSYDQSELMTHVARRLMQTSKLDWIVLLDSDEFIPDSSNGDNEQLHLILDRHSEDPAVSLTWINLVPEKMDDSPVSYSSRFDVANLPSRYNTIALNSSLLLGTNFIVEQGNHSILEHPYAVRRQLPVGGHVYHVPIRSKSQLMAKLGTGLKSYQARNISNSDGRHWKQLDSYRRGNELSSDVLKKIVLYYGELDAALRTKKSYKELSRDFELGATPFASCQAVLSDKVGVVKSHSVSEPEVFTRDDLPGGKRSHRDVPFAELKATGPVEGAVASPVECLHLALEASTWPIRDLTPTAWAGHIPFMYTLFALARPQRYVELGTHHGASFLAACQGAERLKLDTQLVAIDTWQGDEQAGFYGDEVYNQLADIVRKRDYTDSVYLVRERFDAAASLFDSSSIDLLHIDGLHTYEAVSEDYSTWKPKLAGGGTIIFHDTNVHERDFGVWKLWREIESEGISFEFKHAHGLGILHFPGDEETDLARVLKMLNESPAEARFVQNYFETLAPRLELEARIRYLELRTAGNLNKFVDRSLAREKDYMSRSADLSKAESKLAILNQRLEKRNTTIRNREATLKKKQELIRELRERNALLDAALNGEHGDSARDAGASDTEHQGSAGQPLTGGLASQRLKARLRNTTLGEVARPYYRRMFSK